VRGVSSFRSRKMTDAVNIGGFVEAFRSEGTSTKGI